MDALRVQLNAKMHVVAARFPDVSCDNALEAWKGRGCPCFPVAIVEMVTRSHLKETSPLKKWDGFWKGCQVYLDGQKQSARDREAAAAREVQLREEVEAEAKRENARLLRAVEEAKLEKYQLIASRAAGGVIASPPREGTQSTSGSPCVKSSTCPSTLSVSFLFWTATLVLGTAL